MVRQAVPPQPMEVHGGADLHLQPVEGTPHWSRGMPEGGCDPMGSPVLEQAPARTCRPVEREAHAGAGLLAGLVTLWKRSTLEQPVPEGLHPVGGTHPGAVHEELQSMGRTHAGEICGGLSAV